MGEQIGSGGQEWQLGFETIGEGEDFYPPGVDAHTFDFLLSAAAAGVLRQVSEHQRHVLEIYYLTPATLEGIPTKGQREKALLLLKTAFKVLWNSVPPEIQANFSADKLRILKDDDDPEMQKRRLTAQEGRRKQSEWMKKQWQDPEFRARMTDSQNIFRAKGQEATRRKWEEPEYRERMLKMFREIGADPDKQASKSQKMKAKWQDPEFRARMTAGRSAKMKKLWEDPETGPKMREAASKAMKKRRQERKDQARRLAQPDGSDT